MSSSMKESSRQSLSPVDNNGEPTPTYANFSPSSSLHSASSAKQRSTILVHQKSPLLVATPPQITRALAYSHPFLEPLNKLVGILSWTTGDPWESFLFVAAFWGLTLYGDVLIRWAAPVLGVTALIMGMYVRRYSPMSSTSVSGEKGAKQHKRADSDVMRQHKSLDEIVDSLRLFTSRCNILLDPFLNLTDFLSTQRTATSATTQPALTTLFIRILLITPVWILLALPPFYIVTTRRAVLALGTVVLTWHSRPARVCRLILWRSRTIRRLCAHFTGLDFGHAPRDVTRQAAALNKGPKTPHQIAASLAAKRRPESPGIRFTFTLFENQRRWLGIGWTSSMLAYERSAWTDEHLNTAVPKEKFELPQVEGGHARWRWVDGSEWHIEGSDGQGMLSKEDLSEDDGGWIYYDNKWRDGRRDRDGWGRYTRRRKWCRAAELVEITPSTEITPSSTPKPQTSSQPDLTDIRAAAAALSESPELKSTKSFSSPKPALGRAASSSVSSATAHSDMESSTATIKRKGWFRRSSAATSEKSATFSTSNLSTTSSNRSKEEDEDDVHSPYRKREAENTWGVGDEASMGFG